MSAALFDDTPVRCVNCRKDAFTSAEERLRDRWICYGCGRSQKVSEMILMRGAYPTVEDAIREWTAMRRKHDYAASTSIWLAPGGGYFVAGARLTYFDERERERYRGSKRVFRFRRLRRGAPLEILDERVAGATWTTLEEKTS